MFKKIPSEVEANLETEIERSFQSMREKPVDSEEYGVVLERVSKMHKMKTEEKSLPVNLDTVLVVTANIIGILILTNYEREHVIRSKALGFVMRTPRS